MSAVTYETQRLNQLPHLFECSRGSMSAVRGLPIENTWTKTVCLIVLVGTVRLRRHERLTMLKEAPEVMGKLSHRQSSRKPRPPG